jgi:Ni,Fe-hydrogenase III small subunit
MWQELDYRIDICRVTKGGYIEHLQGRTENLSVSPSNDMLPFDVTIPATVPQRSEIQEGLMNYPHTVLNTQFNLR